MRLRSDAGESRQAAIRSVIGTNSAAAIGFFSQACVSKSISEANKDALQRGGFRSSGMRRQGGPFNHPGRRGGPAPS
jgi:hypothetical protein